MLPSVASFETLTRIGFAARGITYILIGWLAVSAGRAAGAQDALATLSTGPGRVLLILISVGLFAYGVWKMTEGAVDLEGHGSDAKGLTVRLGHGVSGAVHLLLGLTALGLALGQGPGGDESESTRAATSWLLDLPAGDVIARGIAIALIAAGLYQIVQAVRLRFLEQLDGRAAAKPWVRWAGRLGYLARGVVFGIVGLMLWKAAGSERADAAGGTGEALASLSGTSQTLVATGLIMFGIFSLVQAVYRRITNPHVLSRLTAMAR